MIPEQIWDAPDIPGKELFYGRPSGSAMPLVWAHAEYLKLLRSLHEKRVFDMPPQTAERYLTKRTGSPLAFWRFNHKTHSFPAGRVLRIETLAEATVHWSDDGWHTTHDTTTQDTGLGVHKADLPTKSLAHGATVKFTFFWHAAARWEGTDFEILVN
jgi:glucoamylase